MNPAAAPTSSNWKWPEHRNRNSFYYLHNAHGDITCRISETGDATPEYIYDAFGNLRDESETDPNPFKYCGEYWDKETGTYYLRARCYNPINGRFLSPDTHWNHGNMIYGDNPVKLNERPTDPLGLNTYTYLPDISAIQQSGNLYAYCMNNPIMYVDENGEIVWLTAAAGGFIGAVVGGGVNAITQGLTKGWGNISWGEVGVNAASGALSGALTGSGAGLILAITGNAVIGAGAYVGTQAVNREEATLSGLLVNAGIGALFGAIGGSSAREVKRLKELYSAVRTTSGLARDWNKMLFSQLFLKEIETSFGQGIRDEVAQSILDEIIDRSDFAYQW